MKTIWLTVFYTLAFLIAAIISPVIAAGGEMEDFLLRNPDLKDRYYQYFLTSPENELRHALSDLDHLYMSRIKRAKEGEGDVEEVKKRHDEIKRELQEYARSLREKIPDGADFYYFYSTLRPSEDPVQYAGFVIIKDGELVHEELGSF